MKRGMIFITLLFVLTISSFAQMNAGQGGGMMGGGWGWGMNSGGLLIIIIVILVIFGIVSIMRRK